MADRGVCAVCGEVGVAMWAVARPRSVADTERLLAMGRAEAVGLDEETRPQHPSD